MRVKRVIQKPWLCGPATLEMLFSWYRKSVDQEDIARATGLPPQELFRFGYSLYVLNHAIECLNTGYQLMVKYDSTVEELAALARQLPVGVEWRCTFREPDGRIWGEGHYCVVDQVDLKTGSIHLIDPYYSENLSHDSGIVGVDQFVENWWDENIMPRADGENAQVYTQGAVFIVAPCQDVFRYSRCGLAPMTPQLAYDHQITPREATLPSPAILTTPGHY
jgi:hypothetical protein